MKSHFVGQVFMFACIGLGLISLVLFFIGPVTFGEYMLYVSVAGSGLSLLFGIIALIVVGVSESSYKRKKALFKDFTIDETFDYKKELDEIRANYFADKNISKNRITIIKSPEHEKFFDFNVLSSGQIYYGFIIMANIELFKKNSRYNTWPAAIIYSTDEYFSSNPMALKTIEEYFFYNDNKDGWVKSLDLERKFTPRVLIPPEITEGREVYITTTMMYRPHLPLHHITDKLLPVIVDPLNSVSSFVVDSQYWTKPFLGYFINGLSDDMYE